MAETSEITWTDATFNPWIGCTKVGPACDFCYAERDNVRRKWVEAWGPGVPRKRTSAENWKQPIRWNNAAGDFFAQHGRKRRVFAASLADIFDNEVDQAWRDDFWSLVKATPNLQWLIVTKRIGNAEKMLPADWGAGYPNVVLIITVANQEEVDRDVRKLLATPARFRGLSIEPMLGPINISRYMWPVHAWWPSKYRSPEEALADGAKVDYRRQGLVLSGATFLDWVIAGGESDGGARTARPMHPGWIRSLAEQCRRAEVAFHFKQWGEWIDFEAAINIDGVDVLKGEIASVGDDGLQVIRAGKKLAGRLVDGVTHDGFPAQ